MADHDATEARHEGERWGRVETLLTRIDSTVGDLATKLDRVVAEQQNLAYRVKTLEKGVKDRGTAWGSWFDRLSHLLSGGLGVIIGIWIH